MAINAEIETNYGETRECYVRLNNVEVSNHGQKAHALFRAFISKEAFEAGASFVAEIPIEFDADVSRPIWGQAYSELIAQSALDAAEV